MARPTYPDLSEQAQTDLQDLLGLLEDAGDKLRSGERELLTSRRAGEELSCEELKALMEAGLSLGIFRRKQVSVEIANELGLKAHP